ncbi:MAG: hypothetical protein H7222_02765 [Methylotenera sp.]|nr:hypothetical protein [Oligoflexia bacterium]
MTTRSQPRIGITAGTLTLLASWSQMACSASNHSIEPKSASQSSSLKSQALASSTLSSLTLINSNKNAVQPLDGVAGHSAQLSENSTIYLGTVGSALNVRANVSGVGSVKFGYDSQANFQIENVTPYAFASDSNGIYKSWSPSLGAHTITATAYSGANASGTAGSKITVHFNVSADQAPAPFAISGLTLINAASNNPQPLDGVAGHSAVIVDNAILDLSKVGSALNIRADILKPGSVQFDLDNGATLHTENVTPYAFAGDNGGVYNSWAPAVGAHSLKVTGYSGADGSGTAGTSRVIHFSVIAAGSVPVPVPTVTATPVPTQTVTPTPTVTATPVPNPLNISSVSLINADSDVAQAVDGVAGHSAVITDNAVIDLAKAGSNLNIRADIANVGSVLFDLDTAALSHIENVVPYALASDNNGDYAAWTPSIGAHILKVTAYSAGSASGSAGATLVIHFTVKNGSAPLPTPTVTPAPTVTAPPTPVPTVTQPPVTGTPMSTAEPSSYSGPLEITKGGIYSGNWKSTPMKNPTIWESYAIKISTSEPVTIQNCHLAGPGILINARYANANLTVRNCSFHGYTPTVDNLSRGRAIDLTVFKHADIQNNYFENTGTPVAAIEYRGNGTTETIKVLRNRVRNINGAYRNTTFVEHPMFQNFVAIGAYTTVGNPANGEIGWNDVINEPGKSASEDLINFNLAGGQSGSWFKVHDNFLRGSFHPDPYDTQANSAGGIQIDGDDNIKASYIECYNNTILQIMNGGMGAAAGQHIYMHDNRVISSAKDAAGAWWPGSWAAVWIFNGYGASPAMSDIRIENNLLGWAAQGGTSSISGAADRRDYDTNLNGGIKNNTEFPAGAITEATQNNEYQMFLNKVSNAGVAIGPQH